MSILARVVQGLRRYWQVKRDPIRYARSLGVKVGSACRLLGIGVVTFGSEPYLITLGDRVLIAEGVRFITHDGGIWVFRRELPAIDVIAPIVIGSNVFVGMNSIIMPGVTVGNNCIIGAGSVVTRNVPDNSVVAGVPARHVRTLDEYLTKSRNNSLESGVLNAAEKRKFLEQRYNGRLT